MISLSSPLLLLLDYILVFVSITAATSLTTTEAHGFLKSPRSRNYYAHVEGADWGGSTGQPPKEYCPHCINLKTNDQICGTGQAQNYDIWTDTSGDGITWSSQGVFTEGQDIIIESTLSTNHAGHIDVFVCPDGEASTQACFHEHPLVFVEDLLYGGPVDDQYPSRAYVSPASDFRHVYRLPMGIHGSKVMLQWRYVTANSCFPPGYERAELGLRDLGWLRSQGMGDCTWPLNWTGYRDSASPEQFFNCAEITINSASPTKSPKPTAQPYPNPVTNAPVISPVSSPVVAPTPNIDGCCHWGGPCGPTWCNESKSNCQGSCAGTYIDNPNPTPTTPSPVTSPAPPTPPTPPSSGLIASTTRYWDCSGGACGCAYLPFGPGTDSQPSHCYSNAMFEAPTGNSFGAKFYGTAAISEALGGGNWMAEGCGKCWKVHGWSNISGKDIFQTTLVLKGTNYCPPSNAPCANGKAHFDIAAPGFDVTEFSQSNTCLQREAAEIEGFQACGRWLIDNQDSDVGCDCSSFNDPVLKAGCDNFYSLLWDNAEVDYEEVECPVELSRLNCWEANSNKYPDDTPEFCASNIGTAPSTPTSPTPTSPSPVAIPIDCTNFEGRIRFETSPGVKISRSCEWAENKSTGLRCSYAGVSEACPLTCGTCNNCVDPPSSFRFKFSNNGAMITRSCDWVKRKQTSSRCALTNNICRDTCGVCPTEEGTPTASPITTSGDEYCCSNDLINCKPEDDWCSESEGNCLGCSARWIFRNPQNCELAWWDDCMGNPDGCCPPAKCEDFGTWAQCRA